MPTSRPATPAAVSDTSSDPGSLSDLESGWTDLESNRSGGRHSSSTISDADDNEDAQSMIDRFEGEAWDGLASEVGEGGELNVGEDALIIESPPAAGPSHFLPTQQGDSDLMLEDWVASTSSLSENVSPQTSTPHMSIHASQGTIRLTFPDPLSNSEDNLLASRSLSRNQSQSTEAASDVECDASTRPQTLSSVATASVTGTSFSEHSVSVLESGAIRQEKSDENHSVPSMELVPSSSGSYTLSIILLGHPPLPLLKSMTISAFMDIVASFLGGSPHIPHGSDLTRIYEVPIQTHLRETRDANLDGSHMHRILISDYTSGSSLSSSFSVLDCPTVAVVFIQPPLSSPSLPSLPLNTRYLPLLLPSVSDGFVSSLLELSPSVLFDHSVSDVSAPDNASMRTFAWKQCEEMNILGKQFHETTDILTVDDFVGLPAERMFFDLKDLILSSADKSKEILNKDVSLGNIKAQNKLLIRKHVLISALLVALLFGSTMWLRGTLSSINPPIQSTPTSQEEKVSVHPPPFVRRTASIPSTSSPPSPISMELRRSRALTPASLKSFAVSVFRQGSAPDEVVVPSTSSGCGPDKGKGTTARGSATRVMDGLQHTRPASIDPATRPLTLDAPYLKSLSILPLPLHPSISKGKGKERAADVSDTESPPPSSIVSLSTRISNALSPLFSAVNHDLRELQEAIDALLHALMRLRGDASRGIGELVLVLSKQAGEGMEGLASTVHRTAQSVGEMAAHRHARARRRARKLRAMGERYVKAARERLARGLDREKGNTKEMSSEDSPKERKARKTRRQRKEEARQLKRQAREQRRNAKKEARSTRAEAKQKVRETGFLFHSVLALVA